MIMIMNRYKMKKLNLLLFLFATCTITASNNSSQIKNNTISVEDFNKIYDSLVPYNLSPLEIKQIVLQATGNKTIAHKAYKKTYTKIYNAKIKKINNIY